MIVTIDGTAGSGKSTAAAGLARRLGAVHLDTGAMYRALTLKALQKGTDLEDAGALARLAAETVIELDMAGGRLRVRADGRDVTDAIRTSRVSAASHFIARTAGVRRVLVEQQRAFAARAGRVVAEGRDQGTVVFPEADLKFFLDADPEVRARRRQKELESRGEYRSFRQVLEEVLGRDRRDATREASPLAAAADAVRLDTSDLSIEEMIGRLEAEVRGRQRDGATERRSDGAKGPAPGRCAVPQSPSHSVAQQLRNWLQRLWYAALQVVAQPLFVCTLGVRVYHRDRLPREGGVLAVSNHQSYLDPVLSALGMGRPFHPMARASLFRFGPLRWLIRSLYAFPVRRGRADLGAVREALRRLRGGAVVLVFPEGTRTADGSIGRLEGGPVVLARRAGVPILPMVIDGAFEAWPRRRRLPRPHRVRVACGRPVRVDEAAERDPEAFMAAVREEMLALQRDLWRLRDVAKKNR